jgi:S-adenosylmethionine:tRNA ribosyltransferase-isomerase
MLLDRLRQTYTHHHVIDLPDIVPEGSVFVFNDSKVRKARLFAIDAATGNKTEFLLVKKNPDNSWQAMTKRAKKKKNNSLYHFDDGVSGQITNNYGTFVTIDFGQNIDDIWLEKHGHIPLPPYIKRPDEESDAKRYQTVYARETGSAAAPTAGLHFTNSLLSSLHVKGLETVFITLHVGLGTFLPVRSENIEDHIMHEETYIITDDAANKIESAKTEGRAIIAVGTTSLRTLESAWQNGKLRGGEDSTSIFIYPPYKFKVVDALFTNFHTPESTLLMLISAFAGRDFVMDAYHEAVKEHYRFFSYGDAMLIM